MNLKADSRAWLLPGTDCWLLVFSLRKNNSEYEGLIHNYEQQDDKYDAH